ncbi:hypothetical protein O3P69_011259 [Scylla paramamosain]|uniref:Reverse transcriptase RNase H-like domain-containing protein n=1 Tax=Scylla paramamosain TaxID=85552 RepID=A0AAW0SGC8_SCYPA
MLSFVSAIQKLKCYLHASVKPLQVFTDCNPLTFLQRNKFTNQRLLRWSLLQPYDVTIRHIKGSENIIADTLSRIHL